VINPSSIWPIQALTARAFGSRVKAQQKRFHPDFYFSTDEKEAEFFGVTNCDTIPAARPRPNVLFLRLLRLHPMSTSPAKWCRKHKIPPLSPEAQAGLLDLSKLLLRAIHEAADSPPPEVRVYYQSMKFILRVAEE
jgi:hypothetical protein